MNFVSLHSHTNVGSPYDALDRPREWVKAVLEKKMSAFAITEHGNMNSLAEFVEVAREVNSDEQVFKPIYGVEAYFVDSIEDWRELKRKYDEEIKKKKADRDLDWIVETKPKLRRRNHLLLLAQNEQGLKNLYTLVSLSHIGDNFYYYPRMDFEMLEKYNEGIIASSACIGGVLGQAYYDIRDDEGNCDKEELFIRIHEKNKKFLKVFGDRWYNEVQWNRLPQQHWVNHAVIESATNLRINIISTVDSHFIKRSEWKDREVYSAMRFMRGKGEEGEQLNKIPNSIDELDYEIYLKTGGEVWESYLNTSKQMGEEYDDNLIRQTIDNTVALSERIKSFYPDNSVSLPSFAVPEGTTADEELEKLCVDGLEGMGFLNSGCAGLEWEELYSDRLRSELEVIKHRGFAKYFLTMRMIINKAKESMLTGAARGSAAGSLISYLLGITDVDPLRFDLQFSRFLTKDGSGWPDIDSDVSSPADLKEKIREDWGKTALAYVSNWNTLKVKNLIKDLAKFYDISFQEVNAVTKDMVFETLEGVRNERPDEHISTSYTPTYEEYLKHSKAFRWFIEEYPELKDHIEKLQGSVRDLATHAGGVIIGDNLEEKIPLIKKADKLQTPWPEGQARRLLEPMGFIKFDILGLGTLKMIEGAIRLILKRHFDNPDPSFEDVRDFYDKALSPRVLNLGDIDVYENIFHAGKWVGIFQYSQGGIQKFCRMTEPRSIMDLAIATSIYRPGPLAAEVDKKFLKVKKNPEGVVYHHPIHKEITCDTFGFLIFQEQISKLVSRLGKDISDDEGQKVRKGLTKYKDKNHPVVKQYGGKFIEGCIEKGLSKQRAETFWDEIREFGLYGFNASHAVSYSIISYQCAWLSHYYPVEWACAYLEKEAAGTGLAKAVSAVQKAGFDIESVNVNTSGRDWEPVDEKTIAQPLSSIKGLPVKAIDVILENRPIESLEELLFKYPKGSVNKKAKRVLVESGAAYQLIEKDPTVKNQNQILTVYEENPKGFKNYENFCDAIKEHSDLKDFSKEDKYDLAFVLTGLFPASEIVNAEILRIFDEYGFMSVSEMLEFLEGKGFDEFDNCKIWFILRDYEMKISRSNKPYCLLDAVDNEGRSSRIYIWNTSERAAGNKFRRYGLYYCTVDYNRKWGFSSRSVKNFEEL